LDAAYSEELYGMFLSEDGLEYLINKFTLQGLEIVSSSEVKTTLARPECKVWETTILLIFNAHQPVSNIYLVVIAFQRVLTRICTIVAGHFKPNCMIVVTL
jgi:hypothetical protein